MRIIKPERDDDAAATAAVRGGAFGALKYCTIALFAGGVLTVVSPRFAAIRAPQKGWMMVAAFLGGFGNHSDTAFTNFERKNREVQIRVAEQLRHDILYGTDEEAKEAAANALRVSIPTPTAKKAEEINAAHAAASAAPVAEAAAAASEATSKPGAAA